jgi:hypothetical protein
MGTSRTGSKRFWRPLIGAVLAYAVAAQTLLIALGSFAPAARADNAGPAFELCLHDTLGAREAPANKPDGSACTHCIFCFAGSHHPVIGTPPAVFHHVHITVIIAPQAAGQLPAHRLPPHSIASPRAPPRLSV